MLDKEYSYNIIVPPVKTIIKCDKKINNISKDFIVKQLIDSTNLVIIAIDNTCWISKTPIILELNKLNIGVEIMSVSSACRRLEVLRVMKVLHSLNLPRQEAVVGHRYYTYHSVAGGSIICGCGQTSFFVKKL